MTTLASLLNLGGSDFVIILGIVLLLFGAKHLPDLARGMSEAMRDLRESRGFCNMGSLEFLIIAGLALLLIAANWLINPHL